MYPNTITMYPTISSTAKVDEVVPLLVAQVQDPINGKMSRDTALSTVVRNRYGGRFSKYYGKVRHQVMLDERKKSAASSRKENGAFTSGQHAALKWDEIHENAQVVVSS